MFVLCYGAWFVCRMFVLCYGAWFVCRMSSLPLCCLVFLQNVLVSVVVVVVVDRFYIMLFSALEHTHCARMCFVCVQNVLVSVVTVLGLCAECPCLRCHGAWFVCRMSLLALSRCLVCVQNVLVSVVTVLGLCAECPC